MTEKKEIYVCQGRWCRELGAERILEKLKKGLSVLFPDKETSVSGCRCTGYCEQGVSVLVNDKVVHEVTEENVFDTLKDKEAYRQKTPPQNASDTLDDLFFEL